MLRVVVSAAFGLAVTVSVVIGSHAWLVVDQCLDAGGRIDGNGWCETESGVWLLETSLSNCAGAVLLVFACGVGFLAFLGLRRILRRAAGSGSNVRGVLEPLAGSQAPLDQ